jgi:hypothetical protein
MNKTCKIKESIIALSNVLKHDKWIVNQQVMKNKVKFDHAVHLEQLKTPANIQNIAYKLNCYETCQLSYEDQIDMFQYLVTSGFIDKLNHYYQDTAQTLMAQGAIS